MVELPLSPEQEAEAERLFQQFRQGFLEEARRLARLLASKENAQLLGATEFEIRDGVHRLGAQALATALAERKKGGTKGRARTARAARKRRDA